MKEQILIVYEIKLPYHKSVPQEYQGTTQTLELFIEDLYEQDLVSHIIDNGWMTSWGNNRESVDDYRVVDRWIK